MFQFRTMLHLVVLTILFSGFMPHEGTAQTADPRIGAGFNTLFSSSEGLGFGFRGRLSYPVNSDLSLAGGLGMNGFILQGRDDAVYVLEPQASAILTLQGSANRAPYVLVGLSGYLPVAAPAGEDPANGPVLHFGYGRVYLLQETTFFWEINPGLVVREQNVGLLVPLRIGVIF